MDRFLISHIRYKKPRAIELTYASKNILDTLFGAGPRASSSSDSALVWHLEERKFALHSGVDEAPSGALSADDDERREAD